MGTILLIILVLLLIGALPAWPYSGGWGYYPSGGVGIIVVILVVLLLAGYVYVVKKGAFDWSESARREAEGEARLLSDMEHRKLARRKTAA